MIIIAKMILASFFDFLLQKDIWPWLLIVTVVGVLTVNGEIGWILDFRKNKRCFLKIGQALKLPVEFDQRNLPSIEGRYRGFYVNILTLLRGYKRSNYIYYTHVEIQFDNPGQIEFTLGKEKLLDKVGKKLGMQDIQTGVPDFDELFLLQSDKKEKVQEIFDHEICGQLVEHADMLFGEIKLVNKTLSYREKDLITGDYSVERILTIHKLLLMIGERVEKPSKLKR